MNINYLQPNEYSIYCKNFTPTDNDVTIASRLIDAFIGRSISSITPPAEIVKLSKKLTGKLKHLPVLTITSIKAIQFTPFGMSENNMPTNCVYFVDEYGHFQFIADSGLPVMLWGVPDTLKIEYTAGFAAIPDDIKVICGMIAQNVNQSGDYSGAKTKSGLDFNVAMFDDSFIPSDIRMMLQKYKVI